MDINNNLGNWVNLPSQFILILIGFIYITKFKIKKLDILIIIFGLFLPSVFLYLVVYWAGTLYLFVSLILFLFNRTKKASTFVYISILFIIGVITDHMATLLVFNSNWKPDGEVIKVFFRIIIFIILFIISVIGFKLIYRYVYKKIRFSLNLQFLLITIIFLTLIAFYYNIFSVFRRLNIEALKINVLIFSIYILIIFILIMLLLYNVYKEQKLKTREIEFKNFENYVNSLEQVNKDMQKFRHDYLNILLSLRGYIQDSDWSGLILHFEENIIQFEKKSIESSKVVGHLENLQILGLKGLVFTKSCQAIENNLNISIEINRPVENIEMNIITLNRVLGILIDNAIEGCLEQNTKEIEFAIIQQGGQTTIIIRNEIKEFNLPTSILFEEGFTTKTSGQGIGLSTVKSIISQIPNVTFSLWFDGDWFYAELLIMEGHVK